MFKSAVTTPYTERIIGVGAIVTIAALWLAITGVFVMSGPRLLLLRDIQLRIFRDAGPRDRRRGSLAFARPAQAPAPA